MPEARLMSREAAAAYCDLSVKAFDLWVKDGRLPCAIVGTRKWDRKAIDLALDKMSGIGSDEAKSSWSEWSLTNGASAQAGSV